MTTKIITDSTSYINKNIKNELNIEVLSLYVTFDQDSFKEEDISNEEFYKKMEQEGIPKSSQPSIVEMSQAIENKLKEGHDVIGVFLSSKMSGTFNNAILVKNMLAEKYPERKIEVLDSESNSMQLGFTAIEGARQAVNNKGFEEVVEHMNNIIAQSRFLFIPGSLGYLKKGGRIGGAGALLGNVLKIIPILTVDDGETSIFKKVRTKKKAIQTMIDKLLEDHQQHKVSEIAVHHINCYDEAIMLKTELQKYIDVDMHITNIGPVIGLHVGPGSIGLAYFTEK